MRRGLALTGTWLAALALDLTVGEPPTAVHPVALAGRAIGWLRDRAPEGESEQFVHGVWIVALPALLAATAGRLVGTIGPRVVRTIASIWLLKSAFALRALLEAGQAVERSLAAGDLAAGRRELAALVSRPVEGLDEARVSSAAIESLTENLADSYVAPLLYYAVGGLPAALAFRVVNTADAMVGYRGKFEHLGKVSARLDDVLSYVPARLAAVALCAAAPLLGLSGAAAARVAVADHRRTASPNAGWPMAAAAGALGVSLEKVGHYRLGAGRTPLPADIQRARSLTLLAAVLATAAVLLVTRGARR